MSNLQLRKLKNAVKNNKGTTLRISAKMFNSDNLPHDLYLTTRQTTKLRNAIESNMSSDVKLSKAQIKKIIMSGGNLGALLSKFAVPLMKIAKPLVTEILPTLGLSAAMSGIDGLSQRKIHSGSGGNTTLIISNKEMNDIMKIIQALEDQGILLKGVSETIKNETKEQKGGALGMILGTLAASLLGNLLSGKGVYRTDYGNKQRKGICRTGYGNKQEIKKKL